MPRSVDLIPPPLPGEVFLMWVYKGPGMVSVLGEGGPLTQALGDVVL